MKLVSYDIGKEVRAGLVIDDRVLDLAKAARAITGKPHPTELKTWLEDIFSKSGATERWSKRFAKLVASLAKKRRPSWSYALEKVHLNAPIPNPEKVICVGQNYLDHVLEQQKMFGDKVKPPKSPIIFAKFPTTLTGPYDPIVLPPKKVTDKVDYETELAFVVGRMISRATQREAAEAVAGYMILNDVSARDCQFSDKQWVRAKSMDGFAPCGPWLVTSDEIPNPHRLDIWTRVNGELLQDSNTRQMIFKIPKILSYLSQSITFKPGDIIATGTPPGVGVFREPPVLLQPGDTVESGIEGIGTLKNPVKRIARKR